MTLNTAQKGKWRRLKSEIIKRPFIAFAIGIKKEDIDRLFYADFPSLEEMEEIHSKNLQLRELNIDRLRPTLTKIVGNRGSVQFADKIGTDSMSIKYIIDKRYKQVPSHDLIAKIEIYLNYLCGFDVSLEYQAEHKTYFAEKTDQLSIEVAKISNSLNYVPGYLQKLKAFDKNNNAGHYKDDYAITSLTYTLDKSIEDLQEIRLQVETILETFTIK